MILTKQQATEYFSRFCRSTWKFVGENTGGDVFWNSITGEVMDDPFHGGKIELMQPTDSKGCFELPGEAEKVAPSGE